MPKSENDNHSKEEEVECLSEARKDALNTINLVLHEMESSQKLTEIIKKSNKKDPLVQEIIRYSNEIIQDTKQVIKKCINDDIKDVESKYLILIND